MPMVSATGVESTQRGARSGLGRDLLQELGRRARRTSRPPIRSPGDEQRAAQHEPDHERADAEEGRAAEDRGTTASATSGSTRTTSTVKPSSWVSRLTPIEPDGVANGLCPGCGTG